MPYIHILIFGIVAFMPEWRRTCLIIVFFALLNMAFQPLTNAAAATGNQSVHLIYVAADFITILALLAWGSRGQFSWKTALTNPGASRFSQSIILTFFMATNLALLLDLKASPYPVYESYKEVIFALNITQILLIGGGIYAMVHRLRDALNNLLGGVRYNHLGSRSARSGHRQHRNSNR